MPAPKRKTEIRQREIVRAALELVARAGLRGLRMTAVARAVGIVPSGIYRHYRNKEEILDAILDFIQNGLRANVRAVLRCKGDALDRLRTLLQKHIRLIRENEGLPQVVFCADIYAGKPRRRQIFLGIVQEYLAEVTALVEEGRRAGVIRPDVDPDAAARLFLGLVQPAAFLWHLSAGAFDLERHAAAGWRLIRQTLAVGEDRGAEGLKVSAKKTRR